MSTDLRSVFKSASPFGHSGQTKLADFEFQIPRHRVDPRFEATGGL